MFDLLIKNGLVFDGRATPPQRYDVAIRAGRIVALDTHLTESNAEKATETIDATGLWVTPGFVDIHTHYDLELESAPGLSESVRHGVTSVVIGNCSLSLALGTPQDLADMFQRVETFPPELIQQWLQQAVSWATPPEYLAHLQDLKLGPNVAALLGHSALRAEVMGLERSLHARATDNELQQMRQIALAALAAGFIGISIDMLPWHIMSGTHKGRTIPSHYADWREYKMLADVCRRYDAVFQVTPNPQRLASLWDILRLSHGLGQSPLRCTILAALDSVGLPHLWRGFAPLLFVCNRLLRCNWRFQTLTEPFTVYSDGPITPLFEEFASGVKLNDCDTRGERQALWRVPEFRAQFRREWTDGKRRTFHRDLARMQIVRCPDERWAGLSFTEAAQRASQEPVEFWMNALEKFDTDLRWVATGANERLAPRLALMRHPHILPGFTDAGAHVRNLGYYDGALSLLKQAVTTGFLSPQQAVARVTGEAAAWFKLNTGTVQVGAKADLLLINPTHLNEPISEQVEIHDETMGGALRMVKRGSERIIEAVYLNGKLAVRRGKILPRLGEETLGEVIHLPPDAETSQRQRINAQITAHPFTDYWDIFVLKHQNRYNIALHFFGVIIFYGLLAAALAWRNPWLLLLLPSSQLVGLIGHYFFERSHIDWQDAVFSVRASRCLNKMFYQLITGKYQDEIARTKQELQHFQESARS